MTAAVTIVLGGGMMYHATKSNYLFPTLEDAKAIRKKIADAAEAYANRANDRERCITFDYLNGTATIDISNLLVVEAEDPLGEHKETLRAWNKAIAEIQGRRGDEQGDE